jgi:putative aldouronate transport system permease protein
MRERTSGWKKTLSGIRQDTELYLFLIPGLVFILLFDLLPMTKLTIAFKDFKPLLGLAKSKWIGLQNFKNLLGDREVYNVVRNTLEINFLKLIFCIPLPMILAIMVNEMRLLALKKVVQTVIYIPHFFTMVVVYSVFYIVFGSSGLVNYLITRLGGKEIMFFMNGSWFRFLLVISDIWHMAGWGTIVYLAAIMGIDSEIYDAAVVDGASMVQRILRITIPCLLPTMVLMFSIRIGRIMTDSFQQVLVFYNPTVYDSADIISTYVYRKGIGQANFSYATAVGLFNSLIGLVMVVVSNLMSRKITGKSVW